MCRSLRTRAGHTLPELLVALSLLCLIAAAAGATFIAQSRLARTAADGSEALSAIRGTAAILTQELRTLVPGSDIAAFAPDSLRLRAFRGRAIACARDSVSLYVRYAGMRQPDPAKDSLLVMSAGVAERAHAFTRVSSPAALPCATRPGETVLALEPDTLMARSDVALVFETGAYHLSNGALRYLRGGGGRQPLTAGELVDDSTDLALEALVRTSGTEPVAMRARLAARVNGTNALHARVLRIPFLNLSAPLDSLAP